MAYNNIFPMTYQPQQMYYPQMPQQNQVQPQTQNSNNLIWVSGEAGAKAYLVAPNTTVTLWDSEDKVIYLKSADATGMPSMKILDYSIRNNSPQETASDAHNEFATKVDVESIRKDILALRERVDVLAKKGDEVNE